MRLVRFFGSTLKNLMNMKKETLNSDRYVWIDLELTGLDIEKDTILEISCIVTTPELTRVHEGTDVVIHQSDEVLDSMNDWSKEHHKNSGLTDACRQSTINLSDASKVMKEYIEKHTSSYGTRYLAGNTVHMDRLFLSKHMPDVDSLFHYRIIDVSSIKILCGHWYPDIFSTLTKKRSEHRALSDINNSIDELKQYRKSIFK